ncbi:MAG: hypothetical protein A2516_07515 [Alphaproteobacteria bacterium RIFOXYD12_FULL_60_8]|nr:MAG: hypothetical protein A2516_07515 [Alphaproteobacteria bacterium RIFOXYD12_FULL_60_8]
MGPIAHLEQIVRPNMNDLHTNFGDIRYAFNAVAAVDALAAHIFIWCRSNALSEVAEAKNDSDYRDQLAKINADFSLVRDIAKAQKHVHLSRGSPQVSKANQVQSRQLGWGQAKWGEMRWGSPPQIVVETDTGEVRVVESILKGAIMFLEDKMYKLGAHQHPEDS